ncbi:hypothetical protein E2542_SST27970 [Spatholobus suberectus]|nr:hypothetical protein E2542_SST27970 [Spatholobus suberectus]
MRNGREVLRAFQLSSYARLSKASYAITSIASSTNNGKFSLLSLHIKPNHCCLLIKNKQKEGEFCATNPSMDDHSNVPTWMDETFNVAYASPETPLQVDHPSNIMSLNTSTTQSEWYRPQMISTVMPLVWPQIPQAALRMPPIRPSPIRPPMRIESQVLNASQIGSNGKKRNTGWYLLNVIEAIICKLKSSNDHKYESSC